MTRHIDNGSSLADGFNQGYTEGVDMFEMHVIALAAIFTVRVVIMLPPVRKRLDKYTNIDLYTGIDEGLDIVAFLVTAMMFYALLGKDIVS